MKRARENKDEGSNSRTRPKKHKALKACTSCKKSKTRCELLDSARSPVRCHRCQVLSIQCSYEGTVLPVAPESLRPVSPPPESFASHSVSNGRSNAGPSTTVDPIPMPPADRIWSFVAEEGYDWSAPMLAIQQLGKVPFYCLKTHAPSVFAGSELSLPIILAEDRIQHLLHLFDEQYTPWLNFKPIRDNSPVLNIVCCAIASRHLQDANTVQMQLQKLADDSISKLILNPRPSESIETIQALLILSLWAPLGGTPEGEVRDGRLLIASAVGMAMNIRLNLASLKAEQLRKQCEGQLSPQDADKLEELLENARLWIALTNTESMLCVGTGRVPLSRRSDEDRRLIKYPESFEGLYDYRDIRLGLAASAFTSLEMATNSQLQPGMDKDSWYDGITNIQENMRGGTRLLTPLALLLDHEQFYAHILRVYDRMTHILLLDHAMREARVFVGKVSLAPGEVWHAHFCPHGVEVVGQWGRDLLRLAENLLVDVLTADVALLSTAPDNLFTMVALAASYVIAAKFLMLHIGVNLVGPSEPLLAKTIAHLFRAACVPWHPAQRAAFIVRCMVARWENRSKKQPPTAEVQSYPTPTTSGTTPNSDATDSAFGVDAAAVALGPPSEMDFTTFLDSIISFDEGFWNNLAQTQMLGEYQ
ncbi:hypothetical protein C8J57DRAFT_322748 [Mycena rebaudengoi]|nr:hypothetical protein C8J57DRAFT_322748 [Mycena rebaudengoi]